MTSEPRRFHLQRTTDVTGVSGTGRVADGIEWPDGTVSIHWAGDRPSTVIWPRLEDAEYVHGHGGHTRIVWDDEAPNARLARIAGAHSKQVDSHGGTDGYCVECDETWPCPTWTWATTDRDPNATWDPADDEPEPACPAGLLPVGDGPVERCIVEGAHENHVSALGSRWTNPDDGDAQ
jgi:hypothetical protein